MINQSKRAIDVWWPITPKPGNFGDILTPYLIKNLSNYKPVWVAIPTITPILLGVGSIISKTSPLTTVWGSGVIKMDDRISHNAKYLAVRGPITRDLILARGGNCPDIFGDPGLLLPKLYPGVHSKKYKIGFVPHYVDYEQIRSWYATDPSIKIINLLNKDIQNVIDQMLECELIVSSSLHGIITAVAYGIPTTWVKLSNKLFGDGVKFQDFFQSVNVIHSHTEILEKPKVFDDWYKLSYIKDVSIDTDPLLRAFPLPLT